jgi:hypothetical protein
VEEDGAERAEREKENLQRIANNWLKWLPAQTGKATVSLLASSERLEGLTRSLKRWTVALSFLTAVLTALTVVLIIRT